MKKISLSLALLASAALIWAAPSRDLKTVSDFGRYNNAYGTKTYFFEGFDFDSIDSFFTIYGLQKSVLVNNEEISSKYSGRYTLIGHSMGGLTALGYAGHYYQTNTDAYNKLEGVITISGANKGASILRGGLPAALIRINQKATTLWGGLSGLINFAIPIPMLPGSSIPRSHAATRTFLNDRILPSSHRVMNDAAINKVEGSLYAQIRDLTPKSDYINNYVAQTTEKTFKKQTGTKTVNEVSPWSLLIGVPIVTSKTEPVYTYYTVNEDTIKFGRNLPVGYIVGLKHNALSMAENETAARDAMKNWGIAFRVGEAAYYSRISLTGGLSILIGDLNRAIDCRNAASICQNIDKEINSMLGSSEGDGFLAKSDQYIPPKFYNPITGALLSATSNRYLGGNSNGYVGFPQYNHQTINPKSSKDKAMGTESNDMKALFEQLDVMVKNAKK
jgi:hypothetical protein